MLTPAAELYVEAAEKIWESDNIPSQKLNKRGAKEGRSQVKAGNVAPIFPLTIIIDFY